MKWLLIITLFGDTGAIQVQYEQPTESVCERTGENYMAAYKAEGTKAKFDCVPSSPFVESK